MRPTAPATRSWCSAVVARVRLCLLGDGCIYLGVRAPALCCYAVCAAALCHAYVRLMDLGHLFRSVDVLPGPFGGVPPRHKLHDKNSKHRMRCRQRRPAPGAKVRNCRGRAGRRQRRVLGGDHYSPSFSARGRVRSSALDRTSLDRSPGAPCARSSHRSSSPCAIEPCRHVTKSPPIPGPAVCAKLLSEHPEKHLPHYPGGHSRCHGTFVFLC